MSETKPPIDDEEEDDDTAKRWCVSRIDRQPDGTFQAVMERGIETRLIPGLSRSVANLFEPGTQHQL